MIWGGGGWGQEGQLAPVLWSNHALYVHSGKSFAGRTAVESESHTDSSDIRDIRHCQAKDHSLESQVMATVRQQPCKQQMALPGKVITKVVLPKP